MPASLSDALGGEGPQRLTCASPELPPDQACRTVIVRITNNANNPPGGVALTSDDVGFTYFEAFQGEERGLSTPAGWPHVTLTGGDTDWWTGDHVL